MSAPKHLWSGDWETESQAPPSLPEAPASHEPAADPDELRPLIPRGWERVAVVSVLALVLIAAGAWAISSLTRSSGHDLANGTAPAAQNSGAFQPPVFPHHHADALGMVLASAGSDRVVVTGVVPGSPATTIGVGAGLQLVTINHRRVTSPAQANAIIASLQLGSPVLLEFAEGGASVTAEIQEPGVP